jgi:hypothetical protein
VSELTDKMRTCAAFLLDRVQDPVQSDNPVAEILRATRDAVDLLIEAANLLEPVVDATQAAIERQREAPIGTYGEPMVLLAPTDQTPKTAPKSVADDAWVAPGGPLPGVKDSGTRSRRSCPQCGSFGYKRVFRRDRQMHLHCGVCSHEWRFELAARHG